MTERQRELLRLIEEAFRGVELGDGVSLHESAVIDDYGGPEERLAARARDEKQDWRKLISDPELIQPTWKETAGMGGLSFYDAAGLRFYLPAYLSTVVAEPKLGDGTEFYGELLPHLTQFVEHNRERFSLLSTAQRACVGEVLKYLRGLYDLPSNEWTLWDLDQAIEGFWLKDVQQRAT
jgi:hypothetical protein